MPDQTTEFKNHLLSLGQRLFPGVKEVGLRGVDEPASLRIFLEKSAEKLARQCTGPRSVPYRTVRESIEKLHRLGQFSRPQHYRQALDAFSSNVNLIHVIHKAPEHLDELKVPIRELFAQNSEAMDRLGVNTLAYHVGIPPVLHRNPESQVTWLQHAGQARRLLASPADLFDEETKLQLRLSYSGDIGEYYATSNASKHLSRWMRLHRLNPDEWLSSTYSKTYEAETRDLRSFDEEAQHNLHRTFYDSLYRLYETRTLDNRHLLDHFFRSVAKHDPQKKDLPRNFIVEAHKWYQSQERPDPENDPFRLPREAMNDVLVYAVDKMRNHIIKRERRYDLDAPGRAPASSDAYPAQYKDFHDSLVALQRTVAGYDHAVSLTTARAQDGEGIRRTQYVIRRSDKDPIHFYTGGNDTGVCDSTAGPQRSTLKETAMNPSVQFHEVFRVDARGREKRIGQIRMYLGEIKKDNGRLQPALLVNSIDLEAEERDNLLLYRRAVDYVKEFAQRVGVSDVRLGRHGDQHLMVFQQSGNFPDLTPVQEHIRLTHFFGKSVRPFSDFFRGLSYESGSYHERQGPANLYHVALPPAMLRRRKR